MNLEEFENRLKLNQSPQSNSIDTDLLWARVEPHLHKPQKKKRVVLIIFLLLGLFSISAWIISQKQLNKSLISENNKNDLSNKTLSDKVFENRITTNTLIQANKEAQSNTNKEDSKVNIIATEKQKSKKQINDNTINKPQFKLHTSNNTIESPRLIQTRESTSSYLSYDEVSQPSSQNSNSIIPSQNSKNSFTELSGTSINTTADIDNKLSVEEKTAAEKTPTRSIIILSAINTLLNDFSVPVSEALSLANPRKFYPYRGNELKKWSLEFSSSLNTQIKDFNLIDEEMSSSFSQRQSAESSLAAVSAQAMIRYYIIPNVSVGIGAHVLRINERSKSQLNYTENIIVEDTIVGTIVKLDGSEEPIIDDGEVVRRISKNISRINRHTFISIPIEVSYHHSFNNIELETGIGIIQNLSLSNKGYWHLDGSSEYDLSLDNATFLKDKISMSLTAHIGMAYDLTKHFGIFTHLRYSKQTKGLLTEAAGIHQRYDLFGAELGMRYHLFNKRF